VLNEDTMLQDAIDLWEYVDDPPPVSSALTFSVLLNTAPNCAVTIDSNRYVDIQPTPNWFGFANVTIQVDDGEYIDTDSFTITVLPVDDPPIITTTDVTMAIEDMVYTVHYEFTEADGDPNVSWQFDTNATSWLTFDNTTTYNLTGLPTNLHVGLYWVNISCIDSNLSSAIHNFTLEVINVPPVILTADVLFATEDEIYEVDYDSDDDLSGLVSWSIDTSAGNWLSIDSATGILRGVPTDADVGTYWVNISCNDGHNGIDYHNFTLTVVNVNDPPQIIGAPTELTINATENYTIDFAPYIIDIDNPITELTLTTTSIHAYVSGLIVTFNYPVTVGYEDVIITVSDGINSTVHTLHITVVAPFEFECIKTYIKDFVILKLYITGTCGAEITTGVQLPGDPPAGRVSIERTFELTLTTTNWSWAFVEVNYTDASLITAVNKTTLRLYLWEGTNWALLDHTDVNLVACTVYANFTIALLPESGSAIFAVFGYGIDVEFPDNDEDGVPDDLDLDDDNDGMPDEWELELGFDPLNGTDAMQDPDDDRLTNVMEYWNGTNPYNSDTDGDKLPDAWEVAHGLDPNIDDADADPDLDDFTNIEEYVGGTDPQNPESYPAAPKEEVKVEEEKNLIELIFAMGLPAVITCINIAIVIIIVIIYLIIRRARRKEREREAPPEEAIEAPVPPEEPSRIEGKVPPQVERPVRELVREREKLKPKLPPRIIVPTPPTKVEKEKEPRIYNIPKSTQCKICLGMIKENTQALSCTCTRVIHVSCAKRVGKCPKCNLEFSDKLFKRAEAKVQELERKMPKKLPRIVKPEPAEKSEKVDIAWEKLQE
jgi:hypothetical protein